MRHHEKRQVGLCQIPFQPFDHIDIKVVGRLIEDKQLRLIQQHQRKCQPFLLTTRKSGYTLRSVGDPEQIQQLLQPPVIIPPLYMIHLIGGRLEQLHPICRMICCMFTDHLFIMPDHTQHRSVRREDQLINGQRVIQCR